MTHLDHTIPSKEFAKESLEEFMNRLGKNVCYFRKKLDLLRQEDLAEEVEVTRQTIISIEKGRRNTGSYSLARIAYILEVSADDLLYGKYDPKDLKNI